MSKKRGVLVWGLFVLATILLFVSSLTVWSKRQLLDDQAWADSSSASGTTIPGSTRAHVAPSTTSIARRNWTQSNASSCDW